VRLHELAQVDGEVVDLKTLKTAGLVPATARRARVFASGKLNRGVTVRGVKVTQGARAAIEAAGGAVE
jgi:large subunit ribosomal protein L15